MADQNDVDLDSIIDRLLEVRGSRPGKQVQLLETEIRYLCTKAREIFISQPILLELEAPIKASNSSSFLTSISMKATLRFMLTTDVLRIRFAGIYMANITIFFVSSNTVDSHQRLTISSLVTMSIEVNSPSKPYAYFSHTRSSILRTFLFSVETMNVPQSTVYMGFTMSARGDTILSCGRHSPTASIACQLQLLSMRKSSRCMEV